MTTSCNCWLLSEFGKNSSINEDVVSTLFFIAFPVSHGSSFHLSIIRWLSINRAQVSSGFSFSLWILLFYGNFIKMFMFFQMSRYFRQRRRQRENSQIHGKMREIGVGLVRFIIIILMIIIICIKSDAKWINKMAA